MTKLNIVIKKIFAPIWYIWFYAGAPHLIKTIRIALPFKETFSLVQFTFSIVQCNMEENVFSVKLSAYNLWPF